MDHTTTSQTAASTNTERVFTCLSCTIAYPSAEEQRLHYHSELHHYNMKRRLASLPPLSATVFNEKVRDRQPETDAALSPKTWACKTCSKSYTTENAYISHVASKKHQDNALQTALQESLRPTSLHDRETPMSATPAPASQTASLSLGLEAANEPVEEDAGTAPLSPTQCLFCPTASPTLDANLTHMSSTHSFFVPDADYLVDLSGLLAFLGERIETDHLCLHCNGRGREFRSAAAVRKHMLDKGHCKVAYEDEEDQADIWDFYDFSAPESDVVQAEGRDTESLVGDDDAEDVPESASEDDGDQPSVTAAGETALDNSVHGPSPLELVLPSGARAGHRSMRRYYAQTFPGARGGKPEDPNSGRALVRRLLADKNSALVTSRGGLGAFGRGTDMMTARNAGEARFAGKWVREHRDQRRADEFRTRVGFIANHQKHYRDPILGKIGS